MEGEWRKTPWWVDKAGGITSAGTLCCAGVVVKPGQEMDISSPGAGCD